MAKRPRTPEQHTVDILHAAGKTVLWLPVSEDEAHALAAGVVCARTQVLAARQLESLEQMLARHQRGRTAAAARGR